ncbi:hypothetical protein [Geminicoccus roseus]|uniref:hypothetical protein n=1 Tax=Geminicoccus roseus TaxID=404900 RepID=UPI0003F5F112|nr:hypothetical protein [Geminicoccus roseus]
MIEDRMPPAELLQRTGVGDLLLGLGGNDILKGGRHNDLIVGGAGQVRYVEGDGKTTVAIKNDGSQAAEMQFAMSGTLDPRAPDFIH